MNNKKIHKSVMIRNIFFRKKLHLAENHIINKETSD